LEENSKEADLQKPRPGEFFMDWCGYIIEVVETNGTDIIKYRNLNTGRWDDGVFNLNYKHFPILFSNKIELPCVLRVLLL
jgi:hypothetical protein